MRAIYTVLLFYILPVWLLAGSGDLRYIENKGQWPQKVLFKADLPSGSLYLEQDRFTFNFLDSEQLFRKHQAHAGLPIEKPLEDYLNGHAYQVLFQNCNAAAQLSKKGASSDYFNYFIGDDPSGWASGVRAYERVTLEDIYTGINLDIYGKGSSMKYDFIVEPGANPGNIQLEYIGVENIKIKQGRLIIQTSVNEIEEMKPFAYQLIDGLMRAVDCGYTLEENVVSFDIIGTYDLSVPLIIDPELQFSTYSGSFADNFGYTASYDSEGFLYSGSSVFGDGYPVTLGAYQIDWAGGSGSGTLIGTDIGITKYDTTGTDLVYSTYIGGISDELPHSLIVNDNGELYVYGTTSSPNYPTTSNAFDQSFGGGSSFAPVGVGVDYVNGSDIIVSKLSADGTALLASTFIGGSGNDGVNTNSTLKFNYADEMRGEILFDANGDVIVASSTLSNDFPVSAGAYQSAIGGGQDGCIVKLDPNLETLLYGTYLGGLGGDATYSVAIDSENHTVVCGGTISTNFPTTIGALMEGFNGTADGYVTVLTENLDSLVYSTYYGTNQYDQLYFVQLDGEDNIYVYGQTRGPTGALIQNAAYNVDNGGMLVAKFEPDLSDLVWSTRFGSGTNVNPNLSPTAFLVDVCNKIYLSGWGGSTNTSSNPNTGFTTGLPVTLDAYQSTTDGSDFYIMVLEEDASDITYASFFGGNQSAEHVDGGTSRFDRSGKIYQSVCAGCGNNEDFPIFPANAWSATNNSNNCNNGVFKFDFDLPITVANFSIDNVCLPEPIDITNFSSGATEYTWTVDGEVVGTGPSPDISFDLPGTYEITLTAFNPSTCNMVDSLTQEVIVYPALELESLQDLNFCEPQPIVLTANSFGTATGFHWSTQPDFSDQLNPNPEDSTVTVNPSQTTTYYVQVSNGFCELEETITVTPAPQAALSLDGNTGCDGDTLTISLENLTPDISFDDIIWSPDEIILSGQGSETISFVTDGNIWINVSVTTENDCLILDSLSINTVPLDLSVSPDTVLCTGGQSAILWANSGGTDADFTWSTDPGFNDVLNPGGESSITVSPEETTTYYLQAQNGPCIQTEEVTVFVVTGSAALEPEFVICLGDTIQITAQNLIPSIDLSFEWSPEDQIISGANTPTITVAPNATTVYEALITTEDGCVFTETTVVYVSDLGSGLVAATADPSTIPAGETAELNAIPNNPDYNYIWSPTDGLENPFSATTLATPEETTTYTVTIIDNSSGNGTCQVSASVELRVYDFVCGPPNLFLPNAFTPNGDGNNDILYLRGDNITRMHLAIYNRWGELVFETNSQSVGWDGTFRGKDVDPAVFVYHLEADCADGQTYFDKGNVTVIR